MHCCRWRSQGETMTGYSKKIKTGQNDNLVLEYKRINRSGMSAVITVLPMTLFSIA